MKNSKGFSNILILLISLLCLAIGYFVISQLKINKNDNQAKITNLNEYEMTQDADINYFSDETLGIKFEYPYKYNYHDKETVNEEGIEYYRVKIGILDDNDVGITYLTISDTHTIDSSKLPECTEVTTEICLSSSVGWGQNVPVKQIILDGREFYSFYTGGGVDNSYHYLQSDGLELKMYVAGGGLEQTFQEVIGTLEFESAQ
jgi:hypothetical protein